MHKSFFQLLTVAAIVLCCVLAQSANNHQNTPPTKNKDDIVFVPTHVRVKSFVANFLKQLQMVYRLRKAPIEYCKCMNSVLRRKMRIIQQANGVKWFEKMIQQHAHFTIADFVQFWSQFKCRYTRKIRFEPVAVPQYLLNQYKNATTNEEEATMSENFILEKIFKLLQKQQQAKKKQAFGSLAKTLVQKFKRAGFWILRRNKQVPQKPMDPSRRQFLAKNYYYLKCARELAYLRYYEKVGKQRFTKQVQEERKFMAFRGYLNLRMYRDHVKQNQNGTVPKNNTITCEKRGPCDELDYRKQVIQRNRKNETTITLNWYNWETGVKTKSVLKIIANLEKLFAPAIKLIIKPQRVQLKAQALAQYSVGCVKGTSCISVADATKQIVRNSSWRKPYHLHMHVAPLAHPDIDGFAFYPKDFFHGLLAVDSTVLFLTEQEATAIIAHEIGHALGLLHTFTECNSCFERNASANGGDFCEDTLPDVSYVTGDYNAETKTCRVPDLSKGIPSPCEPKKKLYQLPFSNIMSQREPGCKNKFSACQYQRMKCWAIDTWQRK